MSSNTSSSKAKIVITFNSPAVLCFVAICLLAMGLNWLTGGWTNSHIFSVYRSSLLDPLTYIRMVGHVFGHSGWSHFMNNMMYILILGPLLEEKYGTRQLVEVILITAVVTGIAHVILQGSSALLGASGVVFAFILLASLVNFQSGNIPLTFILVAVLYIGTQIYQGIFIRDNVSNLTHIIGGIVGTGCGFALNRGGKH